jgi:hypothetical protein
MSPRLRLILIWNACMRLLGRYEAWRVKPRPRRFWNAMLVLYAGFILVNGSLPNGAEVTRFLVIALAFAWLMEAE